VESLVVENFEKRNGCAAISKSMCSDSEVQVVPARLGAACRFRLIALQPRRLRSEHSSQLSGNVKVDVTFYSTTSRACPPSPRNHGLRPLPGPEVNCVLPISFLLFYSFSLHLCEHPAAHSTTRRLPPSPAFNIINCLLDPRNLIETPRRNWPVPKPEPLRFCPLLGRNSFCQALTVWTSQIMVDAVEGNPTTWKFTQYVARRHLRFIRCWDVFLPRASSSTSKNTRLRFAFTLH
jgi:hypothetical protein